MAPPNLGSTPFLNKWIRLSHQKAFICCSDWVPSSNSEMIRAYKRKVLFSLISCLILEMKLSNTSDANKTFKWSEKYTFSFFYLLWGHVLSRCSDYGSPQSLAMFVSLSCFPHSTIQSHSLIRCRPLFILPSICPVSFSSY